MESKKNQIESCVAKQSAKFGQNDWQLPENSSWLIGSTYDIQNPSLSPENGHNNTWFCGLSRTCHFPDNDLNHQNTSEAVQINAWLLSNRKDTDNRYIDTDHSYVLEFQ